MSYNPSRFNLKDRFAHALNATAKKVRDIQSTNSEPTFFQPLASDPAAPFEGQTWDNTTSHTAKIRLNGVTKTFTVT